MDTGELLSLEHMMNWIEPASIQLLDVNITSLAVATIAAQAGKTIYIVGGVLNGPGTGTYQFFSDITAISATMQSKSTVITRFDTDLYVIKSNVGESFSVVNLTDSQTGYLLYRVN